MSGNSNSASTSTTPSSSDQQIQLRRRIKAHRKSRSGCFTCKGRKVKCCETRPQCTNCTRSSLQCVYPETLPTTVSLRSGQISYQANGFSLRDMRFFHDYMTASYPHLPLNCESAWTVDIPLIAQQHEFLMHAMLALGAAHLHNSTNLDLKATVERHRALAMQGLLDSDSEKVSDSSRESRLNAQLATTYALNFAGTYLGDPLSSSMVLARAGANINKEIVRRQFTSPLFAEGHYMGSQQHLDDMEKKFAEKPGQINYFEVERAKASLEHAASVCSFTPLEWDLYTAVKGVLDDVEYAICAYRNLLQLWDLLTNMTTEDFAAFTDANNMTGIVLQAHFLAMEEILRPWLLSDLRKGNFDQRQMREAFQALPSLPHDAPPGLLDWPVAVSQLNDETSEAAPPMPTVTWTSHMLSPTGARPKWGDPLPDEDEKICAFRRYSGL